MENKQTAVEWYALQMRLRYGYDEEDMLSFIKAKQIEKEQMEAAWCNGYDNGWDKKDMDFQEYYDKIL